MALPIFQRTVVDDEGNIVAGATVTVLLESTGLAANIYSDRAGIAPLSNPFTTGSDGLARFYAAPGEYRIQVSGPSTSADWRYQVLTGTSATKDVTESATDTTAGRLLKVGDFGIGKAINGFGVNLDGVNQRSTLTSFNFSGFSVSNWEQASIIKNDADGQGQDTVKQIINVLDSYGMAERYSSDGGLTWSSPASYLHTENTGSIVTEDYEEGTWTPTVKGLTTEGVGTYTSQQGFYTKVGNVIHVNARINMTNHTGTGSLSISGLPFTVRKINGAPLDFTGERLSTTSGSIVKAYFDFNSSNILFISISTDGSGTAGSVAIDTSCLLTLTGFYYID